MRRRLLDWEREAIVIAVEAKENQDAIAAEFGVCRSYPGMLAKRRGIRPMRRGRPKKPQTGKHVLVDQ